VKSSRVNSARNVDENLTPACRNAALRRAGTQSRQGAKKNNFHIPFEVPLRLCGLVRDFMQVFNRASRYLCNFNGKPAYFMREELNSVLVYDINGLIL
jgi:hypothetical protein